MKGIDQQEPMKPAVEKTALVKENRQRSSKLLQDGANLVVIVGIVLALWQISMTRRMESVRLAVEATQPIQSKDFLDAFLRLTTAYREDPDMIHTESLDDDLMLVINVYESILVLYLNNLLEDEIVELRLFEGMKKTALILEAKRWPPGSRNNFNKALKRMSQKHAQNPKTTK